MENIYKKLKNPTYSIHIYSKKNGKNRALKAINEIFDKISFGEYDLSKIKNVLINIASGDKEVTINEISEISDLVLKKMNNVDIQMSIQEKNIGNEIEIQMLLTNLELKSYEIDLNKLFNENISTTNKLPLYFLENEYSNDEISEIISFISDLYQEIGGDELIIRGFQSKLVKFNLEPTLI